MPPVILMVEDDVSTRTLCRHWLENHYPGMEFLEASALALAFRLIKNRDVAEPPIDIVLLDLGLKDCNGIRTLQHFHAEFPSMSVIVVTGSDVTIAESFDAGASDFLGKPVTEQSLLERVVVQRERDRVRQIHRAGIEGIKSCQHIVENQLKDQSGSTVQLAAGSIGTAKDVK